MNFNFENNTDFLSLIKKQESLIIDKTTDNIQESDGFKILLAGLKSMVKTNAFNGAKIIIINETEVINLRLSDIIDFNTLFSDKNFAYNQLIYIDKKLNIINSERKELPTNSSDARKMYSSISKKGEVVFLLLKDKINYFIKGEEKAESPFFSLADVNKYDEKKSINQIDDVFLEYQEAIRERKHYCKFFIELSHLKSLHVDLESKDILKDFIIQNKHVLRNKPEDTFRDDLRSFLNIKLKIAQVKEFLLENMRRLDIYLYDEFGEIYLIEVKWVGNSVHASGKSFGTSYNSKDINPNAFYQTLDYLEELGNKGENIVRAFLVVFDARKDDLEDTGNNFDTTKLTEVQSKNYRKFEKIKDLRVINSHPS